MEKQIRPSCLTGARVSAPSCRVLIVAVDKRSGTNLYHDPIVSFTVAPDDSEQLHYVLFQ
jgi:hypothetical protein